MWHRKEELDQLKIEVKIVTFDVNWLAKAYIEETKITWPLLLDSDQSLYRAYGLERGSWWDLYGITSIAKYLTLIVRGHFPGRPGKDWQQLGGDVLIDPTGTVRLHHVSTSPHDRPAIDELLSAVAPSDK